MPDTIYLDHAATTPIAADVLAEMYPFLIEHFGNPNSLHQAGRAARRGVDAARGQVAALVGAHPHQIVFTGGGSEADNLALKGIATVKGARPGTHVITSAIEHHAVLHSCRALERQGVEVTYLPVDERAQVSAEAVARALREETVLVSIMLGNNEVGSLQPVAEIGRLLKDHPALLHSDAVQAVGHVPISVDELGVDLLSLSAHKFYGPKGVGALYVRDGVDLEPLLQGGGQERGLRGGTENVAGIVGLGAAAKLAQRTLPDSQSRITAMRDRFIDGVLGTVDGAVLTGHPSQRLPGSASFCFEGAMGESLLLKLDMDGVCASTGSACTSGHMDPSHVLLAMGLSTEAANGSLRFSLGRATTDGELDRVLALLPGAVDQVQAMAM